MVPSAERAVSAVEFGAVGAIVESRVVIVHGALVAWAGRGVLLVGRGEAGKSTLACALWERGAALLGDDVALVEPVSAEARPAPRRVSLRETSRAIARRRLLRPDHPGAVQQPSPGGASSSTPTRSSRVRDPRRCGSRPSCSWPGEARGEPACHEPIPPAHALLALLPYTNLGRAARRGGHPDPRAARRTACRPSTSAADRSRDGRDRRGAGAGRGSGVSGTGPDGIRVSTAPPATSMALMVTRRCNMRCAHCSVASGPELREEPSEGELLDRVRQAAAAEVRAINLTGGEPMLRPRTVMRLVRAARRLGVATSLTTNGSWSRTAARAQQGVRALRRAGLGSG